MAIRWDEFPHDEIRLKIYARLNQNAVGRSAEDSLRHILRRRLPALNAEDHRRFIELEARNLVEHLRCTRDVYREFVEKHNCRPVLEAQWVVLRLAVLPTAIALLREQVVTYAKLTRIPGRDLSILFGILTRTCYQNVDGGGLMLVRAPDLHDDTAATDSEIESLGKLVNEDSLLFFRDIREGGGVWRPFGGGPFAIDDQLGIRNSFSLCGLRIGVTLPEWVRLRRRWYQKACWADGLSSLFGSGQEELLSQWRALPLDSTAHELKLREQTADLKAVVVPSEPRLPSRLERGKDCEELAKEIGTIKHKRNFSGQTVAEIQSDCSVFKIWKRVEVLSSEDKDTFVHPGTWEGGYANLLLGKLYATTRRDVAPGTINTWRKEYRAYLKWQNENSSRTADDFILELQQRKRDYRKSHPKE
jgi:hypothetical protein